jgi:class I fructose-bisphosphate aldolase
VQSCFNGRRIVIFSGGAATTDDAGCLATSRPFTTGRVRSIIGRKPFQRPHDKALTMLNTIIDIYLGKR